MYGWLCFRHGRGCESSGFGGAVASRFQFFSASNFIVCFGRVEIGEKGRVCVQSPDVLAPMILPSLTSLCQCTLQTSRLSPNERPRARIASVWVGAISVRMRAQAHPMVGRPDGYEPSFLRNASSFGVQVGRLFSMNGRVRL